MVVGFEEFKRKLNSCQCKETKLFAFLKGNSSLLRFFRFFFFFSSYCPFFFQPLTLNGMKIFVVEKISKFCTG